MRRRARGDKKKKSALKLYEVVFWLIWWIDVWAGLQFEPDQNPASIAFEELL